MTKLANAILLAAIVFLAGCQSGGPMVGTWKMVMSDDAKKQVPAGMKQPEMTLTFAADGTFTGAADMMGTKTTVKGTYKVDGSKVAMTMTESNGTKKNETENVTLSEDKRSFEIPNSNGMGKMVKQ